MIEDLPDDEMDGPEEGEMEEGPPADRPTRGILWVFVPTLLGLVLGAVYKALALMSDARGGSHLELVPSAAIGAGLGLGVGAIIWAFFPYKREAKKDRRE